MIIKKIVLWIIMLTFIVVGMDFSDTQPDSATAIECSSLLANDFVLSIFTDSEIYRTTDAIQIWATLDYVGDNDNVTIWHFMPFVEFAIFGDNGFDLMPMHEEALQSSDLQRGEVYRFDFQKSGNWHFGYAPGDDFWDNFFMKDNLHLPVGEYTVTVHVAFSFTENNIIDSPNILTAEVNIRVVE